MNPDPQPAQSIVALLSDIDGTLITKDNVLPPRTIDAVQRLRERGAFFCVTSGRPPRGLRMFVEPLDRETSTVQFSPVVVPSYEPVLDNVIKIVGTSNHLPGAARCEASLQEQLGTRVTAARSQPYYLDVTHPEANKGGVVDRLTRYLNVARQRIATIGDQLNDVQMFQRSGLSIAMGNASPEVQRQADFVTTSFGDEGFANAVDRFVLPRIQTEKESNKHEGHTTAS